MRSIALSVTALCALAGTAAGQLVVNGQFGNATLSGWTVSNTANGVGAPGTTAVVDIDGPGPLGSSFAAKFAVGQNVPIVGDQQGVLMVQPLYLIAGVSYTFSFDWAAIRDPAATSNAEGGVFSLVVDGVALATQAAGSVSGASPQYGSVSTAAFVPPASGLYNVGVRITRPYTVPGQLDQYVDNIRALSPVLYAEFSDAGDTPATAALVTSTGPLRGISGSLADGDVDMFQINVCNPGQFRASTVNLAGFDTQLFLFRADGSGVVHNDDSAGVSQSTLTDLIVGNLPAGQYFLAVTPYNRDPQTSSGALIWNNNPFSTERAPDGPGAAGTLGQWNGTGDAGRYSIALQGSCYAGSPCSEVTAALGGASTGWSGTSGQQNGRLFRDGIPDTCLAAAPGGAPIAGSYLYDRFVFANNLPTPKCVTVNVTNSCTANVYAAAYVGGYNPANPTANNVASGGSSGNTSFSFMVPANSTFDLVFSEVANTGCSSYAFTIEGLCPEGPCFANCDGSTTAPVLNVNDFICFQQKYAAADPTANCDGSTTVPVLNVNDFICFQQKYAAGCP